MQGAGVEDYIIDAKMASSLIWKGGGGELVILKVCRCLRPGSLEGLGCLS